ncbi:hypothetical protein [Candidatus Liberibacter sp.]|uniref:hypothetical protein n=1 Tax=Candidatus Liberibacter sp. TaxID=34022 RepID=UPI0015F4E9AD|nr:hypothetical protein [Candidatus Liberibacter sp.]MBA5724503.1 hypothetical protein [Candidatus Liberibacter sp.]
MRISQEGFSPNPLDVAMATISRHENTLPDLNHKNRFEDEKSLNKPRDWICFSDEIIMLKSTTQAKDRT